MTAVNGSTPGWATKLARAQALIDRAQRELDAATEMLHRDPTRVRRSTSEREKDRAAIVEFLRSRPQATTAEVVEFTGLHRDKVDAELFWLRGHDPRVARLSKGVHTWREAMDTGAAPQDPPQGQEPPPLPSQGDDDALTPVDVDVADPGDRGATELLAGAIRPLTAAVAQANAVRKAALAAMEREAMERMEATEAQRRPDADSRHDPAPRVPTGHGRTDPRGSASVERSEGQTTKITPPPSGWPDDYEKVEL